MWIAGYMAGYVAGWLVLWLSGYVAGWLCGWLAIWLASCVGSETPEGMWLFGRYIFGLNSNIKMLFNGRMCMIVTRFRWSRIGLTI
jgi:hypothetical protein